MEPAPVAKLCWHHLSLGYALDSEMVTLRLWDESGHLLTESAMRSPDAGKLRGAGDLVLRFVTETVNDKRQASEQSTGDERNHQLTLRVQRVNRRA